MERFLRLVEADGAFAVRTTDKFDEDVAKLDALASQTDPGYNADKHHLLLCTLMWADNDQCSPES